MTNVELINKQRENVYQALGQVVQLMDCGFDLLAGWMRILPTKMVEFELVG